MWKAEVERVTGIIVFEWYRDWPIIRIHFELRYESSHRTVTTVEMLTRSAKRAVRQHIQQSEWRAVMHR